MRIFTCGNMKNDLKKQIMNIIKQVEEPLETTEIRDSLGDDVALGKAKRRLKELKEDNKIKGKTVGPGTYIWWKKDAFTC